MKKALRSQSGAAQMAILLVVVVVAVAGVGFYVWKKQDDSNKQKKAEAAQVAQQKAASDAKKAAEDKRIADGKAKLKLSATQYESESFGGVDYPAGWKPEETAASDGVIVTFTNPTADKDANGNEFSASIVMVGAAADKDLAGYIKELKSANAASATDYKVVKERKAKSADGTELTIVESSFKQGSLNLYVMQAVAIQDGIVGIYKATALERDWPIYQDIFEQIMLK